MFPKSKRLAILRAHSIDIDANHRSRTHVADIDVDPISGRKIINQYEIVDELGRGVHGKVKLGRILPSGTFVAIKIVERYSKKKRLGKNTSHEDKIKKEIAILKKARHPNIVSLSEVIDDPQWKKVYIVLEFVELGEVAWRESGPDDICLIEYRRYLRQSHGIQETEATAAEEHQILDEGRQKREKARRRELKQKLKDRVEGSSSESWSFEHFGEGSDIDESNFDALSYTSSTTSGSHQDTSDPNGKVDALSIPPPHLLPPPVPDDTQTADFATITGLTEATEVMKEQSDQFASGDEFDTVTATGLEGTMYGAYDDLARGRTPSVAGSSSSHIFEDFHRTHVPEHFKYVPLLTLSQARSCFRDTVLGLEYLHFQGVIHRDIKPANLLQTKDHRIKISDFGVSYLGRERSSTDPNESESEAPGIDEAVELAKTVGTPAFYAPELCHTDTDGPMWPVTQQIDVWALGVTLYCLVFGRVPFHDHNPFALMAKIAEEEVHIPRERLKAVEKGSTSRPSSRGRMLQSRSSKRDPFRLEYEAIDDDLYDLLRRLFIKDPRRRINLTEVKHHPWVLMGISNPYIWLEETDPTRDSATKIQVSQEDVADAVAQLNIYERVLRKIGNTFGIGRSSSNRARTKSSATDPNAATLSPAGSSSSTISQDGRRGSVKPDESISAALRAAKEIDHPLAQSQTASPELYEQSHYFAHILGPPSGSEYSDFEADQYGETSRSSRPMLSERANSAGSSSNKTLRPKDVTKSLGLGSLGMGNMTFPALPSTPRTLDSPGANLGGIFGGAGRSLMRKFGRSRDRSAADNDDDARDRSLDRASVDRLTDTSDDLHAEPSLAISDTVASGLLRQPDLPHSQSSSAMPSPVSSRAASITSPDLSYHGKQGPSRQSSISSASSALRRPLTASKDAPEHMTHYFSGTHPADEFDMAREEYFRRRMVEEQQLQDRPPSAGQSLPQHIQGACPPSPDDEMFHRKQQEDVMARPRSATYDPSATHHYVSNTPSLPASRLFTSSSSEDHFASGLSQSTSNPSIPSVVSADSSLMPDMGDERALDLTREPKESLVDPPSDGSTIYTRSSEQRHKEPSHEDDDGYAGDGDAAVESADSDSDDDFIEMTSRKGRDRSKGYSRSESISVGELGRRRARRTNGTGKAARSESNGTMKKIRSRSMSGDEEILKTAQSS